MQGQHNATLQITFVEHLEAPLLCHGSSIGVVVPETRISLKMHTTSECATLKLLMPAAM